MTQSGGGLRLTMETLSRLFVSQQLRPLAI